MKLDIFCLRSSCSELRISYYAITELQMIRFGKMGSHWSLLKAIDSNFDPASSENGIEEW